MYVSYLVDQSLKHGTTKVYLSAILNLQIASGWADPFAGVACPCLMREIKRVEVEKGGDKRQCLPISPLILTKLKEAWFPRKDEYNTKMGSILLMLLCISPSWGNDSAKQRGL